MARVSFTTNLGSVIKGVRIRRERAYDLVNAAATRIAKETNATLIPDLYPGRAAEGIVAVDEPYRTGGRLSAVRVRRVRNQPIFMFYEFGVKPHPEPRVGSTFMAFEWERVGGWFYTYHVTHPGYPGRNKLPDLKAAVAAFAYREWRDAIVTALGAGPL